MKARELMFSPCSLVEIRKFVETYHYSHSVNGVKITQCFKAEYDGEIVGGIIYGQLSTTAWKKFGKTENEVLELRRLVLIDEAERNSESMFIGYTLKWLKGHLSFVKVVVSYADPNYGHTGIIYKASNFTFTGISAKDTGYRDIATGKTYHSRALRTKYKGRYKPFVMVLRDKLAKGELEQIELKGKYCYVYPIQRKKRQKNKIISLDNLGK